ncbi:hypothetical protein LTR95_013938 [Oleoguttula sp. CCFEE 5521]
MVHRSWIVLLVLRPASYVDSVRIPALPRPTSFEISQSLAADIGWTPRPTAPPALPHNGRISPAQLFARQEVGTETCGFFNGSPSSALTCASGYSCILYPDPISAPNFGCQSVDYTTTVGGDYKSACFNYNGRFEDPAGEGVVFVGNGFYCGSNEPACTSYLLYGSTQSYWSYKCGTGPPTTYTAFRTASTSSTPITISTVAAPTSTSILIVVASASSTPTTSTTTTTSTASTTSVRSTTGTTSAAAATSSTITAISTSQPPKSTIGAAQTNISTSTTIESSVVLANASTIETSTAETATPPPTGNTASKGLSSTVQVGIGVGVGAGALAALIGVMICVYYRRKLRASNGHGRAKECSEFDGWATTEKWSQHSVSMGHTELAGSKPVMELWDPHSDPRRQYAQELPSYAEPSELWSERSAR